jgi:hypothetical protein
MALGGLDFIEVLDRLTLISGTSIGDLKGKGCIPITLCREAPLLDALPPRGRRDQGRHYADKSH